MNNIFNNNKFYINNKILKIHNIIKNIYIFFFIFQIYNI